MANDRIAQLPVEALVLPTDQLARIAQLPVEVLYPADNPTGGPGPRAWGYIIG